jgi:hypothetical protein
MNSGVAQQSNSTAEMSVVDRSLKEKDGVSTMRTSTVGTTTSSGTSGANTSAARTAPGARAAATHAAAAEPAALTTSSVTSGARAIRSSSEYSAAERFAANMALALLRWSNRRADRSQPTHERMTLILENERVRASHDPFSRTR